MAAADDGDRERRPGRGARLLDFIRVTRHLGLDARWARARHEASRAWPNEPATCGLCGRRLLAGERVSSYEHPDGVIDACPLCAIELDGAGLRILPQGRGPGSDEPEGEAA